MLKMIDRIIAKYLRKRGWVVFWLDECARSCSCDNQVCWLEIYKNKIEYDKASWGTLLKDKHIYFMYDSDHPNEKQV